MFPSSDAQSKAGSFSFTDLKAIRRRHFCGCPGSFVLAGLVVSSFLLVATVSQVTHWKRSPGWIRAFILLCQGQVFLKVSQNPGDPSCLLICSRTRLRCWMHLQVYIDKIFEVPWRKKSWPEGRLSVGSSQLRFGITGMGWWCLLSCLLMFSHLSGWQVSPSLQLMK